MMAMGITKWQYGYYELIEKRLDPPVIPIRYPRVGFSVRIVTRKQIRSTSRRRDTKYIKARHNRMRTSP